jgi:hypothetical protein
MVYFQTKKIPIWVNFGGPKNGKFYAHFEYNTAIWYILWPFGNFVAIWYIFPVLVFCVNKNLATLMQRC